MTAAFRPMHHPNPELLAAYATGVIGEGPALLVAAHLTFCPECRAAVSHLERVGGALLQDLEPDALTDGTLDSLLARLDEPNGDEPNGGNRRSDSIHPADGDLSALPAPIRSYITPRAGGAALPWKTLAPGLRQIRLMPRGAGGSNARLFKVAPRTPLPDHGHRGSEWTLVLTGSFTDNDQRFARGDVAEANGDIVHAPKAGKEDCICLVVTDAPLRYTGLIARLIQPFTGM